MNHVPQRRGWRCSSCGSLFSGASCNRPVCLSSAPAIEVIDKPDVFVWLLAHRNRDILNDREKVLLSELIGELDRGHPRTNMDVHNYSRTCPCTRCEKITFEGTQEEGEARFPPREENIDLDQ